MSMLDVGLTDFMKKCAKCGEFKPSTLFNRDNARKGGRYPNCRLCEKKRNAARYAENPKKYLQQNKEWRTKNRQKKKDYLRRWRHKVVPSRPEPSHCEVCNGCPGSKGMHLDHCHVTGIFRGWLCHRCNVALGFVRDDPDTLRKLADYLDHCGKNVMVGLPLQVTVRMSASDNGKTPAV